MSTDTTHAPADNSAIEGPPNGPNGTFISYDLVVSVTRASTIPPDPYGG